MDAFSTNPDGPTDAELVGRTRGGEKRAFGELVERYERVILALCRQKVGSASEAEDVLQESFLKAFAALDQLKNPARFGSWLYGIAFRCSIDHLRRRGRASGRVLSLDGYREAGGPDPLDRGPSSGQIVVDRERAARVVEALGELPDKYRLVLTLRYQRHLSYKEIAAHLGEPDGTVANRLHRAIAMLRKRLRALVA